MNRIILSVLLASALALSGCASHPTAARNSAIALGAAATLVGGGGFVEHVILPLTSQVDDIDHFPGDTEGIPTLQSPCWGWGAHEDRGAARGLGLVAP